MLKRYYLKNKEQILYLFYGGLTVVVNWLVYSFLVIAYSAGVGVSNFISWIVAVLFAFFTNKFFVFETKCKSKKEEVKEFFSFMGSRFFTGCIEVIGVPLLIYLGIDYSVFEITGGLAKIMVSIIVIVLNYVLSKCFVFR